MKRISDFPMHLQIFFAVLSAIVLVVLCTIVLWLWSDDNNRHVSAFATFSELVEQNLPPASAMKSAQSDAIDDWMQRTHARFALFDAQGRLLSRPLSPEIPLPKQVRAGGYFDDWYGTRFVWQLQDKRLLVIQFSTDRLERPWTFIIMLLALAGAVALMAFPVIRRLTARLESLQQSVEALGRGNLAERVPVTGSDEVSQLAASFNRSAAQIETLVQSQKTMLANASHELRSPLMRIQMASALLSDEHSQAQHELQRSVAELDTLVEEILTLSRLKMAQKVIAAEFTSTDVTALAAEECASAEIDLVAEHIVAQVDARLMRRLMRNLIENALRYAGQEVVMRLHRTDPDNFLLTVDDRGPGIPALEMTRIFEPFFRLNRSGNGTGLGLALVRSISEYHDGEVSVTNRTGGGASFRVRIPLLHNFT
ncbi:HAMP domain-containing sensor histidine kinase [Pantoea sp. At-9b]|uniref:sensor histidine kinase n=1 Tax=Pantoea sp. (strain At-9b) TaxID=592316 RepID=UPI0001B40A04|nr:ATP-binding protein [Pantoea sp. At-9b]ADU72500.1 integral membrane sensor signal transduction histidine kinase [Pantoea sp. At-9b]